MAPLAPPAQVLVDVLAPLGLRRVIRVLGVTSRPKPNGKGRAVRVPLSIAIISCNAFSGRLRPSVVATTVQPS